MYGGVDFFGVNLSVVQFIDFLISLHRLIVSAIAVIFIKFAKFSPLITMMIVIAWLTITTLIFIRRLKRWRHKPPRPDNDLKEKRNYDADIY